MSQPGSRSYHLNGLIRVTVEGPPSYLAYFDNEYERMSSETLSETAPTVNLRIVDRVEGEAAQEIHYKGLFRFRHLVGGLDTPNPVIEFERHWLDRFYTTAVGAFVQGQLLEPVIYQKLLETGVLFMHCAGVSKDGKAYVFPAHGGTGKTTLSLALMKMGYDLMGDDLLMVDTSNGMVHPYARPLHLFTYNLKSLKVPLGVRLAIAMKDLIRFTISITTGRNFLISTRAHADEIMNVRYGQPSKLEKLVFLKREGVPEIFEMASDADKAAAVEMVVKSADLNESLAENIGLAPEVEALERRVITKVLTIAGKMDAINARAMQTDADRQAFAKHYLAQA